MLGEKTLTNMERLILYGFDHSKLQPLKDLIPFSYKIWMDKL